MNRFVKLFVRDERGVSALEYAILAGIVIVAVVAAAGTLGDGIRSGFSNLASQITSATTSSAAQ
ncbi:Flp family type IVb pilin [Paraburkholderia caballeronis]|uniref:Flp family type IVb pilin n=1 Tax=Paraburkholderia caballeronis TaxID=416943 RepID=UPI001064A3CE|nr:Flp family type IVb pilin [Paraburkholderia caballeronis]TDV11674.1 pilus assembly protein Flp/PilA [Paraburkholderia caballeronis]TDV14755.1 pilus assembly protein Flp/PilA [Paraburkholderia caballeronis]TDV23875.1 pilus assembly protein Flp/PilA [Paraburkholderia caballeronis]TDV27264.1 pilus assembly protein Flp/PilA [Paraburkholderia caballeronis]